MLIMDLLNNLQSPNIFSLPASREHIVDMIVFAIYCYVTNYSKLSSQFIFSSKDVLSNIVSEI